MTQAYGRLRKNEDRNGLIVADVKKALEAGRTPVILTRFTDQAAILHEMLKDNSQRCAVKGIPCRGKLLVRLDDRPYQRN